MKITVNEVEYVAKLARLKLSDQEKVLFTQQLDNILQYMDKLNELDTKDIPPTSHVLPLENVMREDEVRPSYSPEELLANAPDREDTFFAVPKVIE
ncbi:MAG: Asp-tRNA(Asn)/Glu-tRNA(Gln) amidotransferase subunit GatC [bacterium]|nr:Asp-tRNA(Asn)/Glu-tRNA(Gln) amidotransferase subunit GatC [bacterium]